MKIHELRCCRLTSPIGIDTKQPQFSWELKGTGSDAWQSAYRIQVAESEFLLLNKGKLLWDSGWVDSPDTAFIRYAGQPLQSRMGCHWYVLVRDGSGQEHQSPVAQFTIGLLDRSDWSARWIGLNTRPSFADHFFGDAQWIWSHHTGEGQWTFRHQFTLDTADLEQLSRATVEILAEDAAECILNDHALVRSRRARGGMNTFGAPQAYGINPAALRAGENRIEISAEKRQDTGESQNTGHGGLIARMTLMFHDGSSQCIQTDGNWSCTDADGQSVGTKVFGNFGMPPWNLVDAREFPRLKARYLRKEAELSEQPIRALLHVCGLGVSTHWINGAEVCADLLAPNPTDYDERVFYRSYEVSALLRPGRNAFGSILGNGRYFAPRQLVPIPMKQYDRPKLLWQLECEYADGRCETFISDESWSASEDGPIGWNNEFDGEHFDAGTNFQGWNEPGFPSGSWSMASLATPPLGRLQAQMSEPIRVTRRIDPVSKKTTRYGTTIYDFGLNLAGWCRIQISGSKGDRILITHAERLEADGEALFTENLRSAACTDVITLGPDGRLDYTPSFTIHGFRFVEVSCEGSSTNIDRIEACFVHDDLRPVGEFECSSPILNHIFEAATNGIRGNYRGMPTDCPQRDERMGWLGDRTMGTLGELYLFDGNAFYRKWLEDIALAQSSDGTLPDVAPPFWKIYTDNVTWPAAFVFILHWLERQHGDRYIGEQLFPHVKAWLEHLLAQLDGNGLFFRDVYGDWCMPPESPELIHSRLPERITPGPFIASCYLYRLLQLGTEIAARNGATETETRWQKASAQLRARIHEHYYDKETGTYANGTQTAALLPLAFGIAPEAVCERVFSSLTKKILEDESPAVGTGLIGAQWLLRGLSAGGRSDLALAIATRTSYPSLGYMIENGATTIWELWNGDHADPAMNSGNHVMLLGDLIPWLFEDLGGIHPTAPGFRQITFQPCFPEGLDHVRVRHHSICGPIACAWERADDTIIVSLELPANTTGCFAPRLPEGWILGQTKGDDESSLYLVPGTHTFTLRKQLDVINYCSTGTAN